MSYELLEDLYTQAPDFLDKHRQVTQGANKQVQGGVSAKPASSLKKKMNNEFENMQTQARNNV